jgi:hypothetical protein
MTCLGSRVYGKGCGVAVRALSLWCGLMQDGRLESLWANGVLLRVKGSTYVYTLHML